MNINVKNLNQHQVVVDIEGVIGVEECYQFDDSPNDERVSTYEKFRQTVAQIQNNQDVKTLRVNIRSTGGSVQDALLIHSLLNELNSQIEVETHCYGFSASAATIIAQAASEGKRFVSSSALYMIHNSSAQFDGNASEAESVAQMLSKTDAQIASLYSHRSGLPEEHFAQIMARDNGRGEWLTADEAVELGLADVVESYSSVRNLVNSVKEFFGRFFTPQTTQMQPIEALDKVPHNLVEENFADNRTLDEAPTETLAKEDPEIAHFAISLSANRSSYESDAKLFRQR